MVNPILKNENSTSYKASKCVWLFAKTGNNYTIWSLFIGDDEEKSRFKRKAKAFFFHSLFINVNDALASPSARGGYRTQPMNMTHAYRKRNSFCTSLCRKVAFFVPFYTVHFHLISTMPAKKKYIEFSFFLLFLFLFLFSLVCVVVHRYRIVSAPAFGLHLKSNLFLL